MSRLALVLALLGGCTVVERNCTHEVTIKTACAEGRAVIIHLPVR